MTNLAAINKLCRVCARPIQMGDDVLVEVRHDGLHSGPIGLQHEVYVHRSCRDAELERMRHPVYDQAPAQRPLTAVPKPACKEHECRCGYQWTDKTGHIATCELFYRSHMCRVCSRQSPKFSALVARSEMRQRTRS